MASPGVQFRKQQIGIPVPSLRGLTSAVILESAQGKPFTPTTTSDVPDYVRKWGAFDPKFGSPQYTAKHIFSDSNNILVTRVTSDNAKYSAALLKSEIVGIPTTIPDGAYAPDRIVTALPNGLTQAELDAYNFPTYLQDRMYNQDVTTVRFPVTASTDVVLAATTEFSVDDLVSFGDTLNNDTITYEVDAISEREVNFETVVLDATVTVTEGQSVERESTPGSGTYIAIMGNPTIVRDSTGSNTIIVTDSDNIENGVRIRIGGSAIAIVQSKNIFTETQRFITLDRAVTLDADVNVSIVTVRKFTQRDVCLITYPSPSVTGSDISLQITRTEGYDRAFTIVPYLNGVDTGESFDVTFEDFINAFNEQMFAEDVINGRSAYIEIKVNTDCVDSEGLQCLPLVTDFSLWRKASEDIFRPYTTPVIATEDIVVGDVVIAVDSSTEITLGERIRIGDGLSEYKVQSKGTNQFTLDRPFIPTRVAAGVAITRFDATLQDNANGLYNGIQYFAIERLAGITYPGVRNNTPLAISGVDGILLDAGINFMEGGARGDIPGNAEYIRGANLLADAKRYRVQAFTDAGIANPTYAQALRTVISNRNGLGHLYLSTPLSTDRASKATRLNGWIAYKQSLAISSEFVSLFEGWTEQFDEYSKKTVNVPPVAIAIQAQAFTHREFNEFYPAAGFIRGKAKNSTALFANVDDTEVTELIRNRINPIIFDLDDGIVVFGNETTLATPGPLQLRSVNFMILTIQEAFGIRLKSSIFDLSTARGRDLLQSELQKYLDDEIVGRSGAVDARVFINEVTTDTDINNRRLQIFVGISPTLDIKDIQVTFGIFAAGVQIEAIRS